MTDDDTITVVRLDHRPGRDDRTTTHVALVARAFGADRIIVPPSATGVPETVEDVNRRFGGDFEVSTVAEPLNWLRSYTGQIAHLTMYGRSITDVIDDIRTSVDDGPLAVILGGAKVPGTVYELATWNVAVTNQPHSEIGALAVFLERHSAGEALTTSFEGGAYEIVPTDSGKQLRPRTEE